MAGITVDDSRYPLVTVTFDGLVGDTEFDEYLAATSRVLARRTRNVFIFNALRAANPSPTQRSRQAAWMKANRTLIEHYSCGSVFVIGSSIIRGGLTAILWIAPFPGAHTVVATLSEAEQWALGRLRAAGVSLVARHESRVR